MELEVVLDLAKRQLKGIPSKGEMLSKNRRSMKPPGSVEGW